MPVTYEVTIEPEESDFRGNCSAIDEVTDRETEAWIAKELAGGNEYAWCWAKVTAWFEGFEGADSLGAISCKGGADFEEHFLPEMKRNARANLIAEVEGALTNARATVKRIPGILAKLDKIKEEGG